MSIAHYYKHMKHRMSLNFKKCINHPVNQQGQSIVEFVLLLAMIAGISFAFVTFMNRHISRYWEYSVNLVIDDRPGTKTVEM